jgi:hypothetical protein
VIPSHVVPSPQVDFILHEFRREGDEACEEEVASPAPTGSTVWSKGRGNSPVCAFRSISVACVDDEETDTELLEEAGNWAARRLPGVDQEPVVASSMCPLLYQHAEGCVSEICLSGGVYEAFAAAQETPIKLHRCWAALERLCSKDPFTLDKQALQDVGTIGSHLLGWRWIPLDALFTLFSRSFHAFSRSFHAFSRSFRALFTLFSRCFDAI